MTDNLTAETVRAAARSLVEATASPLGVEVATHVLYPNGDYVVVVVAQDGAKITVHDAGLGGMHLAAEGSRMGREAAARMAASAARYDCVLVGGRVTRFCETEDMAASIALVANASRAIGDYAAETRRQNESNFRYIVTESIRQIVGSRLRENESFKGKSGKVYRVPNVILDRQLAFPFAFAVPLASRSAVPIQFRELFDLKAAFPGIYNESIYNDASDFRPDEDGWVLEQVGNVLPISTLNVKLPSLLDIV